MDNNSVCCSFYCLADPKNQCRLKVGHRVFARFQKQIGWPIIKISLLPCHRSINCSKQFQESVFSFPLSTELWLLTSCVMKKKQFFLKKSKISLIKAALYILATFISTLHFSYLSSIIMFFLPQVPDLAFQISHLKANFGNHHKLWVAEGQSHRN